MPVLQLDLLLCLGLYYVELELNNQTVKLDNTTPVNKNHVLYSYSHTCLKYSYQMKLTPTKLCSNKKKSVKTHIQEWIEGQLFQYGDQNAHMRHDKLEPIQLATDREQMLTTQLFIYFVLKYFCNYNKWKGKVQSGYVTINGSLV